MIGAALNFVAIPFAIVPVLSAVMGERARPILSRINQFLEKVSGVLMPLMLARIGLLLLADSVMFFVTGEAIF